MEDKYVVNTIKGIHFISFKKIMYFKASGRYTWIFEQKRKFLVTKNIGLIEKEISQKNFLRIHSSFLVNPVYINLYNKITSEIILIDHTKLKVADRRIPFFKKNTAFITQMATLIT